MAAKPSTHNYQIPTGVASFKKDGTNDFVDLGDVSAMSVSNQINKKPHFRHRGGRRAQDDVRVTQVGATVKFTMDEITADNLAIFALATPIEDSDGNFTLSGLTETDFRGILRIVGDNEVGPQIDWEGQVLITPTSDFNFIQDNDDDNKIQVEADVLISDAGDFGVWTVREAV